MSSVKQAKQVNQTRLASAKTSLESLDLLFPSCSLRGFIWGNERITLGFCCSVGSSESTPFWALRFLRQLQQNINIGDGELA